MDFVDIMTSASISVEVKDDFMKNKIYYDKAKIRAQMAARSRDWDGFSQGFDTPFALPINRCILNGIFIPISLEIKSILVPHPHYM